MTQNYFDKALDLLNVWLADFRSFQEDFARFPNSGGKSNKKSCGHGQSSMDSDLGKGLNTFARSFVQCIGSRNDNDNRGLDSEEKSVVSDQIHGAGKVENIKNVNKKAIKSLLFLFSPLQWLVQFCTIILSMTVS